MSVLQRSWQTLLLLQLIGIAVSVVIQAGPTYLQYEQRATGLDGVDLGATLGAIGLSFLSIPPVLIVNSIVVLASVYVVVATALGRRATVGEALRGAMRRTLPLVGWSLVAALTILAGICACLLPGLYLWLVFLLLAPVVAFEREGVFGRCFQLFHVDLGAALARTLTILGLTAAAAVVGAAVAAIVGFSQPAVGTGTGGVVTATVLSLVVTAALGAAVGLLTAPLTVVAYADLRARREPLSAQQLAAELVR